MLKKTKFIFSIILFLYFFVPAAQANIQEKLIQKYANTNNLYFEFVQKIGEDIEIGNCYLKYPMLMKCEYPKKKKLIIANNKKLAVIKKRYKRVYIYPLKKTPLFFLLNKENILKLIQNYKPSYIDDELIEYRFNDNNSNEINIFFDKDSLNLSGWKTIDAYSNEVNFLIKNVKTNILIKDKIFSIPKEEDL